MNEVTLFLCLLLLLSVCKAVEIEIVTCSTSQYFDSIVYKCLTCDDNMIPDESVVDSNGNFVRCKCASGYNITEVDCSGVS